VSGYASGGAEDLTIRLSGSGAYFDNVTAAITEDRDEAVACVARDLIGRRFVIATAQSLYSWTVQNGATYVGPVPFKPLFIDSRSDFVVIADGQQVAFSSNAGLTFSTFEKAGVSQIFAHPQPLVVLDSGEIFSVSGSGLTPTFTSNPGSWLAYDAKRKQFYLTKTGPDVSKMKNFSTEDPHSKMSRSVTAGNDAVDRAILALDTGKLIGWVPFSRDLFHYDSAWSVSLPLTEGIQAMQEVK